MRLSAILIWIVLHLLALALAAARVPLWAHHPLPRESLATVEVAAVQIISTALLCPVLLPNFPTSCAIVALSLPFVHLAGILAGESEIKLLAVSSLVLLWIGGVALLMGALRTPRAQAVAVALISAMCLGTPLLCYLHNEATPERTALPVGVTAPLTWIIAACPLLVGVILIVWQVRTRPILARKPHPD
jgi:hypothetical protein